MKRKTSRAVLKAPAKINLGLWVGPKRADGYHEIVSIIVPLELCDIVSITLLPSGITVKTDDPAIPSGPGNLAYSAAQAFFAALGVRAGCRIHIRKRIPVGAGLGGGSSDAAAILKGLNLLHEQALPPERLRRIAARLGSDIPALLLAKPCVVRGRGEKVRSLNLPCLEVLLHYPGYPISTTWAYAALDRMRTHTKAKGGPLASSPADPFADRQLTEKPFSPKILARKLRQGELEQTAGLVSNSFEMPVFNRFPHLKRVKRAMLDAGCLLASLSGSGSTVFGLVKRDRQDPMAALERQGISCIRTRTIQTESV